MGGNINIIFTSACIGAVPGHGHFSAHDLTSAPFLAITLPVNKMSKKKKTTKETSEVFGKRKGRHCPNTN